MIRHQNFLIVLLVVTLSCQQSSNYNRSFNQNTLAIIGDKRITVNDFIKRCEYVPRPPYCGGDSYIHKKIALNSLSNSSAQDRDPIFVLGMPRSGSTLVEAILSSGSENINSLGECHVVNISIWDPSNGPNVQFNCVHYSIVRNPESRMDLKM